MSPPIFPRIDGTELILVAAESVAYGLFLVLLTRAVEVLWQRKKRGHRSNVTLLLGTALLLFGTISAHWVLDVSRAYDAFIYAQDKAHQDGTVANEPNPATLFFEDITTPKYLALAGLYQVTTTIGDTFMIYRLYIVWGRNLWITVVPLILEIVMNVMAGKVISLFARAHESIFATAGGWITAFFVTTFAANVLSTGLISYKVWQSNRKFVHGGGSSTSRILHVLVQSASLYSVFLIVTLGTYIAKSNVQFVMVAMNNPIIGIIFTMIIARTGSDSSYHSTNSGLGDSLRQTRGNNDTSYPMRPMAIKITTEVDGTKAPPSIVDSDDRPIRDDKIAEFAVDTAHVA